MKEIEYLCKVSSSSSSSSSLSALMYMQGRAESFGGNFSAQERFSYFDYQNGTLELPCGFFKDFPISDSGLAFVPKLSSICFFFFCLFVKN